MSIASLKPLALAAALAFAAGTACAGNPGQGGMNVQGVIDALTAAGYTDIDDGMWEADAEQGGVDYDVYMDPQSAEVVARTRD